MDHIHYRIHRNLFSGFPSRVLEDLQNQTIICKDYSTTQGFGESILSPDKEHASRLVPRKLDFSSREALAVRRHETCQTDTKKTGMHALPGLQPPYRRRFYD
jgi:hypothetical protein